MAFFEDLTKSIKDALSGDIDDLMKGNGDDVVDKPQEMAANTGSYGQKAIITYPSSQVHQHFIFRNKLSRISNKTLKDVSVRDWVVSAILQARCDTMLRFARPQRKNLEMGYKIQKKNPHDDISAAEKAEIADLEDLIYHCGRKDHVPPGEEMLFGEFLKLCTRDALTYGHVAIEKVLTRTGSIHRFRPLPGESVYLINPKTNKAIIAKEIQQARITYKLKTNTFGGNNPEAVQEFNEPDIDYYKYVQMSYDNRVLAAFGDQDMIWKLFNPVNFADSMGYCYPPKTARVLLANGDTKFIEDIIVGDKVFSHTGKIREVKQLKNRQYSGDLVVFETTGMVGFKSTPEHPFLVMDRKDFNNWKKNDTPFELKWKSAKDLSRKDLFSIPKLKAEESISVIDMAKYGGSSNEDTVYTSEQYASHCKPVKRFVPVNDDLGWLIGLYAGDGYVNNDNAVSIVVAKNQPEVIDRLRAVADSLFGLSVGCYERDNVNIVNINSKVVAALIKDMVPGDSLTKKFNPDVLNFVKSAIKGVIIGLIESDGHVSKKGDVDVGTSSWGIANGIFVMCNMLGFLAKIKEYDSPNNHFKTNSTRKVMSFPRTISKILNVTELKGRQLTPASRGPFYHENDDYFFVRVGNIKSEAYSGPVHNFEVEEDHSYIANQVVSHNCYSPLELAIINTTNHLNVENYNSNFFTHGYAARGILHLKGTVTQSQLTAFRRQFYNTISGTQNAWRTPIIAGLDEVQWTALSGNAKEMEYLNYNNHLMRSLCSQFQIDPIELGLDYLVSGGGRQNAGAQQANNEYKVNFSRERGLIPILMMFEDMINCSIIPAIDHELAHKYEFKFTGIDEDSPQTAVAQQQAEMTVHSTMNDLLRANGKETMKVEIADLPMNQTFWMLVEKNMTKAEIRATFFGDKEAMSKRELAYFPADPAFLSWQQMLVTIDRSKAQDKIQHDQMKAQEEQANQQAQQAGAQQELEEKKHGREQEAHDMEMDQIKARQAHAAVASRSTKDIAKESGLGTKAISIEGVPMANPVNTLGDT